MEIPADYNYEGETYSPLQTKFTSNNDADTYTTFSHADILINWVNSFEYPNCLLASKISDFKDGIIFCELVNEIILRNQIPDFLPKIISNDPNYEEKLHNMTMALSEIKSMRNITVPQNIKELGTTQLIQDDNKALTLLKFLNDVANENIPLIQNNHNVQKFQRNLVPEIPEQKQVQDFVHNRSELYSNISTQPSPYSQSNNSKIPQKPPLNPNIYKNKSPNNATQGKKNEKPSFTQSSLQQEEPYFPYDQQERKETFLSTETTQKYSNTLPNGYKETETSKNSTNPHKQYFMTQYEDNYQQGEGHSANFFTLSPQQNNNNESRYSTNEFLQPEEEVPRSFTPSKEEIYRQKSYKNISYSGSKPEYNRFSTPTGRHSDYPDREREDFEYLASKYDKGPQPTFSDYENQSLQSYSKIPFQKSPPVRNVYIPIEQKELGIVPMEIQQKITKFRQEREDNDYNEYDYGGDSYSQFMNNEVHRHKKIKSKSEHFHPAPEEQETRPEAVERKPLYKKKEDKELAIMPVTDDIKKKLLSWLYSIGLLKEGIKDIEKKLPKVCKNGLIFIDIINRLEGRNEVIRGISRNSKTKSQINSNYLKTLDYLKGFQKMNPRYLAAHEYLAEGHEEVFWGFLDDIWNLYNKKISPFDPRYTLPKEKVQPKKFKPPATPKRDSLKNVDQSRISNNDLSYNDICASLGNINNSHRETGSPTARIQHSSQVERKSFKSSKRPSEVYDNPSVIIYPGGDESSIIYKEDEISPRPSFMQREQENKKEFKPRKDESKIFVKPDYLNSSPKNKNYSFIEPISTTPTKSITRRMGSFTGGSPSYSRNQQTAQENIPISSEEQSLSIDVEIQVTEWLKQMGYKALLMRDKTSLFDDPFRNGTLLCYVLGRVENERMHGMYKEPRTIDECRSNVYKAFQILKRKHVAIPSFLHGREESVIRGDRHITLTLLYSLMKIHKNRTAVPNILNSAEKESKYEVSGYIPPYSEKEMEELEQSLINWIDGIGLLHGLHYKPKSIREIMNQLKSGVLLCDLITVVTNEKIISIHRRPTTELHCLTNIRKALEVLRSKKEMGQKYLWKDKEIAKGNKYVLVGLLEDLHRLYNGEPPRKNPNYFGEGPYIPVSNAETTKFQDPRESSASKQRTSVYEPLNNNYIMGRMSHNEKSVNISSMSAKKTPAGPSHYTSNLYEQPTESRSGMNLSSDEPISLIQNKRKTSPEPTGHHVSGILRYENSSKASERKSVQFDGVRKVESSYTSPKAKLGNIVGSYNNQPTPKSPLSRDADTSHDFAETSTIYSEKGVYTGSYLKEWLISLGFSDLVRNINFDNRVILEMKDGTTLCKIIEKLEMKEIPGVIWKPRTNASGMVNIRKCFNVLSKKPGVNPHNLYCEDKILAGDGHTIRKVLSNIKDAYKFAGRVSKQRGRSRSSSSRNLETSETDYRNSKRIGDNNWDKPQTYENYNKNASERKRMLIPTPKSYY